MSKPFFILAPMDDVTDVVFRSLVAECAPPDLFFTEFVNVDGLQSTGRPRLIHKLAIDRKTDHKIIAQIWGKTPENFKKTASELVDMGFDGVDINMGCPEKTVVKNGCCSALINNRELAGEIIHAVQEGVDGRVPVSVKTRLGFNDIDFTWHEYLLGFNLDMLTVHMRTRKEMSDVDAHWDLMPELISRRDSISPQTKIVGNGDVRSREHGIELATEFGSDGIMIGRGVFKDTFCFADSNVWESKTALERVLLYKSHVEKFARFYTERQKSPQTLKRFCKVYVNGFSNASELRDQVMNCNETSEIIEHLDAFIEDIKKQ